MNLKSRNLVLSVVCLVLAIPTALQLYADADTFVDVGRIPLMFQGFTSDNAGAVLIAEPKAEQQPPPANPNPNQPPRVDYTELLLLLDEGTWRIGQLPNQAPGLLVDAPIRASRLESDVFHHLRMIRNDPETLVLSNATDEQLKKYGLDVEHAYLIKVVDKVGNVLAELFVGDDSSVGSSDTTAVRGVFVRQVGSRDVVLYEWQKPWRRNIDVDQWVEPVLERIQTPQVRRLTIKNLSTKGKAFVFEREPGKALWVAKAGGENLGAPRQSEIEGLIQRFGYLAVDGFERNLKNAGNMATYGLFPTPAIEVSFTYDDGGIEKKVDIAIGNRVEGRNIYYMTCSLEPDFIMTWNSSMVTNFELDVPTRMFDPKPPK